MAASELIDVDPRLLRLPPTSLSGAAPVKLWNMEDEELLAAAREHLEQWRSRRGAPV